MKKPRALSLHQLTVMDATPPELIEIAAAVGCPHVGVFVRSSARPNVSYPLINDDPTRRAVLERCRGLGVTVHNLEVFIIGPATDPAEFEQDLAMGAALGGARLTALIGDPDLSRAFDRFCDLCARAAAHGLAVHLEFHAFSEVKSLTAARRFLAESRPANASVALDALHLYRNDGGVDGLKDIAPLPIGYAQICDGPLAMDPADAFAEAIGDRMAPGEGEFDLMRFVRAIPRDVVIDVEAPSRALKEKGFSPLDRARHMTTAARAIIAASEA